MNGTVLIKILKQNKNTRNIFQGFSTPDVPLPNIKKFPALIILNSDTSTGPGEHWCVIYIKNKNICEFFDPYGISPNYYNFTKQLLKISNSIIFNTYPIQGIAPTCGHHCVLFSIYRCKGYSAKFILNNLYDKNNLQSNDMLAYNYILKNYGPAYAKFVE